ncbi:MAG: tyrosine-type recombinase/integrase [Coriobacteriales bacterium]|jgi:integrase|nr:tyrosine-type recombinase/integrase [Coriobacteriales bacterium]
MSCDLGFTGPFKDVLPGYIAFKRSLGYDYKDAIVYRLREIDRFFGEHGVSTVSVPEDIYSLWAAPRGTERPTTRVGRINALNGLAGYLRDRGFTDVFVGSAHRIPREARFAPYIFSREEVATLFSVLTSWWEVNHDRGTATFSAMFALYYGCGLRKSEAQSLTMRNLDLSQDRIAVIDGKNHVSRYIFMSDTVAGQLSAYVDAFCVGKSDDAHVFSSSTGKRYQDQALYKNYHALLNEAGIPRRNDGRSQRLHDLRHTFCVRALESMVDKGFDIYTSLSLLSVYLGHKKVTETEYYLRLVEEDFTTVTRLSASYAPEIFPKVGDGDER